MITLREIVRSDKPIAAITADECHFLSEVLSFVLYVQRHSLLRYLVPKSIRDSDLKVKMLAAAFDRAPQEPLPSVEAQIQQAMEKGSNAK